MNKVPHDDRQFLLCFGSVASPEIKHPLAYVHVGIIDKDKALTKTQMLT